MCSWYCSATDSSWRRKSPQGETALMMAAKKGKMALVRQLLERGANAETLSGDGETARHLAMRWQHLEVAECLAQAVLSRRQQTEAVEVTRAQQRLSVLEAPRLQLPDQPSPTAQTAQRRPSVLEEEELRELKRLVRAKKWKREMENYLHREGNLHLFYVRLQSRLGQLFIGYKTLSSDLVSNNYASSIAGTVTSSIRLLGGMVPLPGFSGVVNVVTGLVDWKLQRNLANTARLISELLYSLAVMDSVAESVARLLCFQYEEQIMALRSREEVEKFVDCCLAVTMELLQQDLIQGGAQSLASTLVRLIPAHRSRSKNGFLGLGHQRLKAQVGGSPCDWTDEGIFHSTGIQLDSGACYIRSGQAKANYGFRLGWG